ncbi:MAG: hypothetical protein WCY98_08545 [Castellaniella sp.]
MKAVIISIFALSIVSTILRAVVLSRHAHRLLAHDIWKYDVGARLAWVAIGLFVLVVAIHWGASCAEWVGIACSWAIAFAAVQWLPPYMARLF